MTEDVWQVADSKGTIRDMNGSRLTEDERGIILQQMYEFYGKNWTWDQVDRYLERSPAMKHWRRKFGPANMRLLDGIQHKVPYRIAAQYLDVSLEMIRRLVRDGELQTEGEGQAKGITKASLIKRRPA